MRKYINFVFSITVLILLFVFNTGYSQSALYYFKTAVKLYSNEYYPEARMMLLTLLYTENLTYPFDYYSSFLIAMTYAKESNLSRSISELKNLQKKIEIKMKKNDKINTQLKTLYCEVNYQIAKLYFFEKKPDLFFEAKEFFDSECLSSNKKIINELNLLEIASLTYEMKWKEALHIVKEYSTNNDKLKSDLVDKLTEVTNHRDKSPILGGLLSIIPGLGHIYAGRYSDGLRSFLFNTTFSGLTIYTAIHKEYLFSAIFGLIELTLYASNIYGGIDAVLQENALFYTKSRDNILKKIPISNIHIMSVRKEIGL